MTGRLGLLILALAAACGRERKPVADTAAPAVSDSTKPKTAELRTARGLVLFAGTSLTAGLGLEADSAYPMMIQRKIDSAGLPFTVTNAGVSGETSSGLLDRLEWLLRANFDVLVIETGANDGLRGIPASTVRANLAAALDRIKAAKPNAKVVLVQMEALPNLGPVYAREFHDVYPEIAKQKKVTLLPFLLDNVAGRRELNQGDGVHPNNAGERIVAANVWKGLKPILDSIQGRARLTQRY